MKVKSWKVAEAGKETDEGEFSLSVRITDIESEAQAKKFLKLLKVEIVKADGQEVFSG